MGHTFTAKYNSTDCFSLFKTGKMFWIFGWDGILLGLENGNA
jgi:hypothetical protein